MLPAPGPDAQPAYPACISDRVIHFVQICQSTQVDHHVLRKDNFSCSICATQDPGVVEQTFADCTVDATTLPGGINQGVLCVSSCTECR